MQQLNQSKFLLAKIILACMLALTLHKRFVWIKLNLLRNISFRELIYLLIHLLLSTQSEVFDSCIWFYPKYIWLRFNLKKMLNIPIDSALVVWILLNIIALLLGKEYQQSELPCSLLLLRFNQANLILNYLVMPNLKKLNIKFQLAFCQLKILY